MKDSKFIAGLLAGFAAGLVIFLILSFRSVPEPSLPQSSSKIKNLNASTEVYKLYVDNSQYIAVVSSNGGTAIIKHQN
ncbi:MAG: hypothetical protein IH593_05025 [Bacteroidales bacterium]|nr:hypothetical protein [Bacteroidales bacterium]